MKLHFFIPSLIFLLAILYLYYSNLTISKAITSQKEFFVVFMTSLSQKDILFTIIESFKYVFYEIIIPLLPFLLLTSLGFLSFYYFKGKIEFKFLFGSQVFFLFIVTLLTKVSIVMISTHIGILIATLSLFKTFEPKKGNFSTSSSLVSSGLNLVNIFLAFGLFMSLYVNYQAYEKTIIQSNLDLAQSIMPDLGDVKKIQSTFVNQTADDLKQSIDQSYQQISPQVKQQCGTLYDALIVGIDNYKEEFVKQSPSQETTQEQMLTALESVPIITQIIKATPLILAVAFLSLLQFVKPFIALIFGIAYTIFKKIT